MSATGRAGRAGKRTRVLRAAVGAAVVLPLSGGLLLVQAPSAAAAVQSPGEGTVYTADTTVSIRADYPRGTSALTLTSPGGPEVTVASGGSSVGGPGTLTYSLDTACWTFPSSSCSGRVPAPNGTWTVRQTGSETDRVTFVVRIPPAAPDGVSAEAVDARQVRLSWRRGIEPDLQGYVVSEGGGTVREVSAASCESGTCSATVAYDQDGTGTHTYSVRALRSDGGSGSVESGATEASATLAAPPRSPEPEAPAGGTGSGTEGGGTGGSGTGGSGTGSTGGSTGGSGTGGSGTGGSGSGGTGGGTGGTGPGGTGSGGTGAGGTGSGGTGSGGAAPVAVGTAGPGTSVEQAVAQRKAFALSFSSFGPKLGIPKLPPLPQAQAPAVAPEPDGTFSPTLGFEDQVVTERTESQSPAQRVTGVVGRALDSEQLVRSTAGALVLLLLGAHLRRWLGAASQD